MHSKELRELADQFLERQLRERPLELKDDLMKRMQEVASRGCFSLDFCFCDKEEVIFRTINLLREEGFKATKLDHNHIIRFEW